MEMQIQEQIELTETTLEGTILQQVKICGLKSKNDREYPLNVLRDAMPLYHMSPVYVNHSEKPNRAYQDRIGFINNVSTTDKGLYGDLVINPHHVLAESLMFDFKNNTRKIGLSQVVLAETTGKTVTKINEVRSIDLVNDPATVQSLKEEEDGWMTLRNDIAEINKEIEQLKLDKEAVKTQLLAEIETMRNQKKVQAIAPTGDIPKEVPLDVWIKKLKGKR